MKHHQFQRYRPMSLLSLTVPPVDLNLRFQPKGDTTNECTKQINAKREYPPQFNLKSQLPDNTPKKKKKKRILFWSCRYMLV
ncbi:hypothetical protein BHE74_00038647 [Ensete ventricosum]|nr:hypothetical protein BHE74_00038647 [Ensete ventricosum]